LGEGPVPLELQDLKTLLCQRFQRGPTEFASRYFGWHKRFRKIKSQFELSAVTIPGTSPFSCFRLRRSTRTDGKGATLPWINIDFYAAVTLDHKDADLASLLKDVGDLKPKDRLVDRGPEYADYIEVTHISHGQIFGGAAKVRKIGIPNRFNLKTYQRHSLGITTEEGLEEVAYFIYDSSLKTLALQRHRLFRSGAWQRLVSEIADTPFNLEPRLRKDKWDRFKKMDRIASLELALVNPDQHPALADVQPSLGKMLEDASQDGNAFRIDLKFSMAGARKASLTQAWVRKIVSRFRSNNENLEKFAVTGASEDGEREAVDFLRDRLVFSGEVEYSSRSLDSEQCWQLIRRAIHENRDYLKGLI
jgi:Family of unknown function (DUF6731)